MSFSERMKIIPTKQIQMENMDSALRNRIINRVEDTFSDSHAKYVLNMLGCRTVQEEVTLSWPLSREKKNLKRLVAWLDKLPWNKMYDVIEYGYDFYKIHCEDCNDDCNNIYYEEDEKYGVCKHKDKMCCYLANFNSILEQEKSGYRIIGGVVSPIVGETEMECVEEASNTKFHSVNTHLQKALQFYSDRENPDYENSIKESISAVESMCCIITEMSGAQATLGNAPKHLEDNGLVLHGALKAAFGQIYGYTSDSNGIRHGGIDFTNAPAEDAKYMLVSCSAFINYLIEKYSKIGGTT